MSSSQILETRTSSITISSKFSIYLNCKYSCLKIFKNSVFGLIGFVWSKEIQWTQTHHSQNFQHIFVGGIWQAIDKFVIKQNSTWRHYHIQRNFSKETLMNLLYILLSVKAVAIFIVLPILTYTSTDKHYTKYFLVYRTEVHTILRTKFILKNWRFITKGSGESKSKREWLARPTSTIVVQIFKKKRMKRKK